MDEESVFLELMRVVDFYLAGLGHDVQTRVVDHFGGMLADFLVWIDIKESGVCVIDVYDDAFMVCNDDPDLEVVDYFPEKIFTLNWRFYQ